MQSPPHLSFSQIYTHIPHIIYQAQPPPNDIYGDARTTLEMQPTIAILLHPHNTHCLHPHNTHEHTLIHNCYPEHPQLLCIPKHLPNISFHCEIAHIVSYPQKCHTKKYHTKHNTNILHHGETYLTLALALHTNERRHTNQHYNTS